MACIVHSGGGGGSPLKVQDLYVWFEDGIVHTSKFGGFDGKTETNGKNNLGTMATDGYLRIYNTQSSYGRSIISTANYVPKGDYDFVMFYIESLTTSQSSIPFTMGGKTSKDNGQASQATYTVGNVSLSNKWVIAPLAGFNAISGNSYFAFGGTINCKIKKIYFVKLKVSL